MTQANSASFTKTTNWFTKSFQTPKATSKIG